MHKSSIRKLLFIIILPLLFTVVAFLGAFNRLDKWIQDDILLRPQALTGDVIVIGIDDDSLERLGPYNTWDRNVMATALWSLSADSQNLPAVVAIDALYSGESDPIADNNLTEAVKSLFILVFTHSSPYIIKP